jgi:chromosome partitioning protein
MAIFSPSYTFTLSPAKMAHFLAAINNPLALNGLNQLVETLESMRRESHCPEILGIIACRANPRRRIHREIMADLEKIHPGKIAPIVRENVALAEAPALGKPITLFASDSKGAEDYRHAAQWMLKRLG